MSENKLKKQIKTCPSCNRDFNNRRRWEVRGIWIEIIYCSDKCRQNKTKK